MKAEVFYCKDDMHVRPMQFSIMCTPTDSSDKAEFMCSTILPFLFTSKYNIGNRLNHNTVSINEFINM